MQIVATSGLMKRIASYIARPAVTLPPGTVDVHVDVLLRVLLLEEEQLRDDEVRQVIVDRAADEDDSVFEQARINVVSAFAARRLLDHHRYQMSHQLP